MTHCQHIWSSNISGVLDFDGDNRRHVLHDPCEQLLKDRSGNTHLLEYHVSRGIKRLLCPQDMKYMTGEGMKIVKMLLIVLLMLDQSCLVFLIFRSVNMVVEYLLTCPLPIGHGSHALQGSVAT